MEYIIENVTSQEVDILEKEEFDWYPDTIEGNDVVINGDIKEVERALRMIGRR